MTDWSSDLPTRAGWYWTRLPEEWDEPEIVQVYIGPSGGGVVSIGVRDLDFVAVEERLEEWEGFIWQRVEPPAAIVATIPPCPASHPKT